MSTITSSNRSSAEWARYIERPESPAQLMRTAPHQPAVEHARQVAIKPGPFDHVIAVDECGAPITADTIGADITIARQ